MKLLPLGTVLHFKKHNGFIMGYTTVEKEQGRVTGYIIAPYPLGFTSIEKTAFIPHDYEFSVVAEGYKTKASENLLDTLGKSLDAVEHVPQDEIKKLNDLLKGKDTSAKEGSAQ